MNTNETTEIADLEPVEQVTGGAGGNNTYSGPLTLGSDFEQETARMLSTVTVKIRKPGK